MGGFQAQQTMDAVPSQAQSCVGTWMRHLHGCFEGASLMFSVVQQKRIINSAKKQGRGLALCPHRLLRCAFGRHSPDGSLGRIGWCHERVQRIEHPFELSARVAAKRVMAYRQRANAYEGAHDRPSIFEVTNRDL